LKRSVGYLVVIGILLASQAVGQVNASLRNSPKHEVRAVWITTILGLDWPKSLNPTEQKQSLLDIIEKLDRAHFNTIFFQVRGRADACYRSHYEPWSQQLTGTLGEDPGWDPLAFLIEHAHKHGMEVHAWFNTFFVRGGTEKPPRSMPGHIVLAHPKWVYLVDGDWWLDPGLPAVRQYTMKVAMDIVRNYNVDGMHFDYIRYPARSLPDDATFKRYGGKMQKEEWRRENITSFVRMFHDSAITVKPMLKIGSAPIGIYTNINGTRGLQGYSEVFQDSRRWLREGMQDYLAPQVYWTFGEKRGDPDFTTLARDWEQNSYGKQIYLGIGAYKPEVARDIPKLIDSARSAGVMGTSFFRYESIRSALDVGNRYSYPAIIPPMVWKDAVPPHPPRQLNVVNLSGNTFRLRWMSPVSASDGDGAKSYIVYRSTTQPVNVSDPSNIIEIVHDGRTEYIDTIAQANAAKYFYAVSSLDKGNNESTPTIESIVVPEIVELSKRFALEVKIGRQYPNPASSLLYIPYEINAASPVVVKILDGRSREVVRVVDAIQNPGRYVAAANISKLEGGNYTCLLVAGNARMEKMFSVKK
jgi:uncharacterized lipoprotein YddW (UPF0748 family)